MEENARWSIKGHPPWFSGQTLPLYHRQLVDLGKSYSRESSAFRKRNPFVVPLTRFSFLRTLSPPRGARTAGAALGALDN